MDNKAIANIFYETADLMEINGDDSFRIRSYRRAAEAVEALPQQVAELIEEPKKLLEIPGIGKGMAANMQEIVREGELKQHQELLRKYRPAMLELLKIQGLGPKTIALLWSEFQVCDLAGVEQACARGQTARAAAHERKDRAEDTEGDRGLSRHFRPLLLDEADRTAEKLIEHLQQIKGIEKITPAGSLRRGRETVGDLDVLITGPCCVTTRSAARSSNTSCASPASWKCWRKGENKVSFKLRNGMQVDVRTASAGVLRRRHAILHRLEGAQRHPAPARAEDGIHAQRVRLVRLEDDQRVAGATEDEIYGALGLDCIPPELRENCGEMEAAAKHALPQLITLEDIRGEVHMHTVETEGAMHHRRDGAGRQANAATSTSPSPITPRIWPSPTASTTSAPCKHIAAFAPPTSRSRESPSWRASRWTYWPTARSTCPTPRWRRWMS